MSAWMPLGCLLEFIGCLLELTSGAGERDNLTAEAHEAHTKQGAPKFCHQLNSAKTLPSTGIDETLPSTGCDETRTNSPAPRTRRRLKHSVGVDPNPARANSAAPGCSQFSTCTNLSGLDETRANSSIHGAH